MTFGPIHCPDECCGAGGPFDWCGPGTHTSLYVDPGEPLYATDLFYRTPSVLPAGKDDTYSSVDEGWWVDYAPGEVADVAQMEVTICPFYTPLCWVVRSANDDHPEGGYETDLLDHGSELSDGAWTLGDDADYDVSDAALRVTTNDETSEATISQEVTLSGAIPGPGSWSHMLTVHAKNLSQVPRLRVTLTNVQGSLPLVGIIDLVAETAVFPLADDVRQIEVGNDELYWAVYFQVDSPADDCLLEVRLVDGLTTYDGDDGDGAGLLALSVRRWSGASGGLDVSLVDMEDQEVDVFRYVSKTVNVNQGMPSVALGPVTEEQCVITAHQPNFAAGIPEVNDYGDAPFNVGGEQWSIYGGAMQAWGEGHAAPNAIWASEHGIGFLNGGSVLFTISDTGATRRWWGASANLSRIEYRRAPWDEYTGGDDGPIEPNITMDAMIPRIVAVSPHAYPKVWSIIQPKKAFREAAFNPFNPLYQPPWDEGETFALWTRTEEVTQSFRITHGAVHRESYTFHTPTPDNETRHDVTWPVIEGGDSTVTFFTREHTQDRVFIWTAEDGTPPEGTTWNHAAVALGTNEYPPHIWGHLVDHDHNGEAGIALIYWHKAFMTITGDAEWYSYQTTGTIGTEALDYIESWVTLHGGSDLFEQKDVVGEPLGLSKIRGLGIAHENRRVWFEGIYVLDGSEWVQTKWRMHVTAGNAGGVAWSIDSDEPSALPDFVQSSDRHIFVKEFPLCDPRMQALNDNWAITLDGTISWPIRAISSTPGTPDAPRELSGIAFDCIKNSVDIPLCPRRDEYPDRLAVWFENATAIDFDPTEAASYEASRLEMLAASVDADDIELACDVSALAAPTPQAMMRYRVLVTAEPGEVTWLLVRWENFHGAGLHAEAWLNLTAKSIATTAGLIDDEVEAISGPRARYVLTLENPDGDFAAGDLVVRLVDGNESEEVSGAAGDGATVAAILVESQCRE